MIYIIIIFSFLFEATFTNVVNLDSILIPLFTLISLSLIYPYFEKNIINFIIVCTVVGLFYDLIFTNTPFINTISFMLASLLIILNFKLLKYNVISLSIFNIVLIVFYRFFSFMLLCLIDYRSFNYSVLLEGIYTSIIINIVYGVIMCSIIDKLAKILNKKK